jgi:hypothetical protein
MSGAEAIGYEVTHRWPEQVRRIRHEQGRQDHELSERELRQIALDDLDGVRRADVFWLLVPETSSVGCWVELGWAYGLPLRMKPRILVSGPVYTPFVRLADRIVDTDAEALRVLDGWVK